MCQINFLTVQYVINIVVNYITEIYDCPQLILMILFQMFGHTLLVLATNPMTSSKQAETLVCHTTTINYYIFQVTPSFDV